MTKLLAGYPKIPSFTYAAPVWSNTSSSIVIFNFFNPNVLVSLVITPDVPQSHTYTPLLTSNPVMSLFTV